MLQVSKAVDVCMWCDIGGPSNDEHIIPEALGCPTWFVLKNGVCTDCNSANGTIDNALLKALEPLTFILGVPRKRGRPPSIANHSSFAAYHDETGPHLFFNRGTDPVELPTGKKLGPTSKRDVLQNLTAVSLAEKRTRLSFDYLIVLERNAVRALFKIALEAIAFQVGLEFARGAQFDPIRDFVRKNKGDFQALQVVEDYGPIVEDGIHLGAELRNDGTGLVSIRVLGLKFICDFDPKFRNGANTIACGTLSNQRYITLPNA
jgi:hypothetical protein